MNQGTVVKNKDGLQGVIIKDSFNNCNAEEIPVVYEGTTEPKNTQKEDLIVIGPENPVANMKKCGACRNRKEECCIFLISDFEGPRCGRFGPERYALIFQKGRSLSQREPTEMYPDCQFPDEKK